MAPRPLPVVHSWPGIEATSIAWSPDGAEFASAIRTEIAVTADDPPGRRITAPDRVLSLTFAPSGDQLLAAPYRVDLSDGSILADATDALSAGLPRDGAKGFGIRAAAWSPDGAVTVLAGKYQPPRGIPAREGWSGPATRVVCSEGDDTSVLWESATAGDLVVAAGRNWLAFADTTVRLVPRPDGSGAPPRPIEMGSHDSVARTLAFDDDESHLAVGFADGSAAVYATADGTSVAAWHAHDADVWALAWLGDRLLSGGGDGSVRLFTPQGAPIAASDPREFQPIVALAVHPGGESARASIGGPRAELLELDLTGA